MPQMMTAWTASLRRSKTRPRRKPRRSVVSGKGVWWEKKAAAKTPKRKEVEVVEKTNVFELRDYVINEGRKEFTIQRYKGLGEMTAPQLWETTMDPERRTLLSVRLEDIAECETIFTTLMG